ncbi:MAG: mannose-1-phosphate guanylyltransferase [Thermoguttaceae bacterium]|nr:mannose-1-phosphate guanylyltransferase [Thermoguttaceae bacterium]
MLHALILAGGIGRRLWPESDENTPKQFLSRDGKNSLLAETISRLQPLISHEHILISTTKKFSRLTEIIVNDTRVSLITEPVSRNTAPAIALAALILVRSDPEAVMVVLPSDHFIDDTNAFLQVLKLADTLIKEDSTRLVTFGITPRSPATGYGYIKASKPLLSSESIRMHTAITPLSVDFFTEKPDRKTAEKYIAEKGFFWNSGIFVWRAEQILDLIAQYVPELEPFVSKTARTCPCAVDNLLNAFSSLPSISVDKGVMEKASNVLLIPAPFRWSDLGTFETFSKVDNASVDIDNNSVLGATLFAEQASNNIVRVSLPRGNDSFIVALGGIDRLLVVLKDNKLLIVPQGREDLILHLANKSESN